MTHKLIVHNFSACMLQNCEEIMFERIHSDVYFLFATTCHVSIECHLLWFWLNAIKEAAFRVLKSGSWIMGFIWWFITKICSNFIVCILSVIATHAANFYKLSIVHLAKFTICPRHGTVFILLRQIWMWLSRKLLSNNISVNYARKSVIEIW